MSLDLHSLPPPLPSSFNASSDLNFLSTVIQIASLFLQQAPALPKKGAFCLAFAFSCVSDGCLMLTLVESRFLASVTTKSINRES